MVRNGNVTCFHPVPAYAACDVQKSEYQIHSGHFCFPPFKLAVRSSTELGPYNRSRNRLDLNRKFGRWIQIGGRRQCWGNLCLHEFREDLEINNRAKAGLDKCRGLDRRNKMDRLGIWRRNLFVVKFWFDLEKRRCPSKQIMVLRCLLCRRNNPGRRGGPWRNLCLDRFRFKLEPIRRARQAVVRRRGHSGRRHYDCRVRSRLDLHFHQFRFELGEQ